MKMLSLVSSLALAFFLSACASQSNNLKVKKMTAKDRIFVGRMLVDFNGKKPQDLKCELYTNGGIVPDIKLAPDGYIFFKTSSSEFKISRIACYEQLNAYEAAWHHQRFPFQTFARTNSNNVASYFGDIIVTWKTDPADTKAAAAKDTSSVQFPRVGVVEASGDLKVEVRSDLDAIQKLVPERVMTMSDTPITVEPHPVQLVTQ